jgi:hypothetical protein
MPTMTIKLNEHETAERAYELWEARGRPEGSPETDWFRAEQELTADLDAVAAPVEPLEPLAQEAADTLLDEIKDEPGSGAEQQGSQYVAAEVVSTAKRSRRARSMRAS